MGTNELRKRAIWQDKSGFLATKAEHTFHNVFDQSFKNTNFSVRANPQEFNKIYVDFPLLKEVKKEIYAKHPKHSAYRSGLLVQEYKKRGGTYSGDKSKGSLGRWFKEDWKNQRGETGYKKKGDVYRPTKRVSSKTPTTFKELSTKEIKAAQREKASKGRVKEFKKS